MRMIGNHTAAIGALVTSVLTAASNRDAHDRLDKVAPAQQVIVRAARLSHDQLEAAHQELVLYLIAKGLYDSEVDRAVFARLNALDARRGRRGARTEETVLPVPPPPPLSMTLPPVQGVTDPTAILPTPDAGPPKE